MRKWRRWFTWTVPMALLAGCATNPFVDTKRPVLVANATASDKVRAAIDYADRVYDAYAEMPSKEYVRQQNLSTGMIVAGAATLGFAAGTAHRDAIVGTALMAGTAYQIGKWNTSATRGAIFIEGRKSLSCARAATAPLDLSGDELDRIRVQVERTVTVAREGSTAAGLVTRWLSLVSSSTPTSDLVAASHTELTTFAKRYAAANKVIAHAGGSERLVSAAGGLLTAHVDNVRMLVDMALDGTLAALSALPGAIGDLGKSAAILAPGLDLDSTLAARVAAPNGTRISGNGQGSTAQNAKIDEHGKALAAPSATRVDPADELAQALGKLREYSGALGTETHALQARDPVALEKMQAAIAVCNPEVAKSMRPLALDPATVTVTAGEATASAVLISGGTTPYSPILLPMKGIGASFQSDAILLTTSKDTVAGSYPIRVRDATGASVTLTVTVVATEPTTTAETAGPKIQKAAPLAKKGDAGAKVEATPARPAATTGVSTAEVCVPPEEKDACLVAGALCSFECVSPAKLQAVRANLGLPASPAEYDIELREKLLDVQKSKGLPQTRYYDRDTSLAIKSR